MKQNELKTGYILEASINRIPFVYHYGIVLNTDNGIMVVHNTPNEKNSLGGNLIIDDLDTWQQSRNITKVYRTNISENQLKQHIERHKSKRFHLILWNCEHFVFSLRDRTASSPQLVAWTHNILLFVGLAVSLANSKMIKKMITTKT